MFGDDFVLFFTSDYFEFHLAYVFIFGLFFGSFFNVCIYRIPLRKSIVSPGSHCYTCNYFLKWYDNIPLLSYILLLGKCRKCGARFSPRYFFVELLTAVLFSAVFYTYRYSWASAAYIVFTGMLIIATFTDVDHWIIPDSITLPGCVLGLTLSLAVPVLGKGFIVSGVWPITDAGYFTAFYNSLLGAVTGFVVFYSLGVVGTVVFRKEAMGGGDVKLLAFVGSFVGWSNVFLILILSSLIGTICGGSLLLSGKIVARRAKRANPSGADGPKPSYHHIPFGPYLAASTYVVLVWGPILIEWYYKFFYFPVGLSF